MLNIVQRWHQATGTEKVILRLIAVNLATFIALWMVFMLEASKHWAVGVAVVGLGASAIAGMLVIFETMSPSDPE